MGCTSSKEVKEPSTKPAAQPQQGAAKTRQGETKPVHEKVTKDDTDVFKRVDNHARKAPSSLKNSVPNLVEYLSQPSKQPKMVARAIFVWISQNVTYDVDGFFGRAARAPCDAESVMKNGKSVCEGYASVMEILCSEAGIPVKKISGYSKGFGSSAEKQFSTNFDTDHAWNAVELEGEWFLVDSTWGAGHLDKDNRFKKSFNEFYFLTDPNHFIYSHFPYMNGDMQESMKWQLLQKPLTLEEFNRLPMMKPQAFISGVRPVSHKEGLVKVTGEIQMSFSFGEKDDFVFSTMLMFLEGNMLCEQPLSVFNQIEDGLFKVRIHPNKPGTYQFTVFGGEKSEDRSMNELVEYWLKCEKAEDDDFQFPYAFVQAQADRCILKQPLQYQLKQNSMAEIHLTSPYLARVMVNQTFLEKNGTSFKGLVKTGPKGSALSVFGSRNTAGKLNGLYQFEIV